VTAVSALSNTSQRSVYNYARRPILRTGLRPVQLFLVMFIIVICLTGGDDNHKVKSQAAQWHSNVVSVTSRFNVFFYVMFAMGLAPEMN